MAWLGWATRVLDDLTSWSAEPSPVLAGLRAELAAGYRLAERVLALQDAGDDATVASSVAKVWATELLQRIARVGSELLGADGVVWSPLFGDAHQEVPLGGRIAWERIERIHPAISVGANELQRDTIARVGSPIITFVSDAEVADAGIAPNPTDPAAPPSTDEGGGSVLVGYGTGGGATSRRRKPAERQVRSSVGVIAKPPIRKLAKDLGVDLSRVAATGELGEVTRDDVIREASQASVFRNIQTPEVPTDRETRIPVKGVRKAIASAMVQSAYSAPHVSVFVDVDATRTMEYVKRLKASPDYAGVRVSPLLIMAKAMIWAVRRNPTVNAQWTDEEIVVKHYVNLGVAAATPRGLIVPNVKEAQAMTMVELATALEQLTLTAREGKTQPAEMQGGTITVTNIGVFGMDTGTPILNPGEVAIVALGTI